jgi:hypothetical protein
MSLGKLAVLALAVALAFGSLGAFVGGWVGSEPDPIALASDDDGRRDDALGDVEVVDDDRGDGDRTRGNDGTRGGNNTGDGDRTRGNDGTGGGNNTGDGDYTAGNDGTGGGDNTYVAGGGGGGTATGGGGGGSASGGGGGDT